MYEAELRAIIEAGKEASQEVLTIYKHGFNVKIKEDQSPVTDADIASDKILRKHFSAFSDVAYLSEEEADDLSRLKKEALFIVDPLDGTADYVNRDGTFGINIAFVVHHEPVVSMICVPAKQTFAYAVKGRGSYYVDEEGRETRMHVSDKKDHLIALVSKTHLLPEEEDVLKFHQDKIEKAVASGASTKAIMLAMGKGDLSIRFTDQTKEWDVCAPDLVVREAGGVFTDSKLKPFTYNRKDVYNHDGYSMFNNIENTSLLRSYLDAKKVSK